MNIKIAQEKRKEIERIQREFAAQLSPKVILRSTAQAINGVLSRSIPKMNKGVKAEYNITQKYLSRMATVSPKAHAGSLWGGIKINECKLPIIAFKAKQSGSSISVSIHKGKRVYIQHSFIATMLSGHTGVYSRGRYAKKQGFIAEREKTASGKIRITERQTASVYTMGTNKQVAAEVQEFMGSEVIARVQGILTSKVNKLQK